MVVDALSTVAAVTLALFGGWALGPTLGRWSTHHRSARFLVGLLTELRMLPMLAALVPVIAERSGLPLFVVIGGVGSASRAAVVARWMSHAERPNRSGLGAVGGLALGPRGARFRLRGAAGAAMLGVPLEVALLEGIATFFGEGRGVGLGAALAQGRWAALAPLVLIALVSTLFLERSPARHRKRAAI